MVITFDTVLVIITKLLSQSVTNTSLSLYFIKIYPTPHHHTNSTTLLLLYTILSNLLFANDCAHAAPNQPDLEELTSTSAASMIGFKN